MGHRQPRPRSRISPRRHLWKLLKTSRRALTEPSTIFSPVIPVEHLKLVVPLRRLVDVLLFSQRCRDPPFAILRAFTAYLILISRSSSSRCFLFGFYTFISQGSRSLSGKRGTGRRVHFFYHFKRGLARRRSWRKGSDPLRCLFPRLFAPEVLDRSLFPAAFFVNLCPECDK